MKFFTALLLAGALLSSCRQSAPVLQQGPWQGSLERTDGRKIVFNFDLFRDSGRYRIQIRNASERIEVPEVKVQGDSFFFHMPVYESRFAARIMNDGSLQGTWYKGSSDTTQRWPFRAFPGVSYRFKPMKGAPLKQAAGRWSVTFTRANGTTRPAVAEFHQQDGQLSGTIMTPTGDYRYMEGLLTGDSLLFSVFDGAHAFLLTGTVADSNHIINGRYYSGPAGTESWEAVADSSAVLPDVDVAPHLKPGQDRLHFRFPDLDSQFVSIDDPRYKNKVVVIQIMGSWCPNCMDETRFLSKYYDENKKRGVEVIALAYEYSDNFARSVKSLRRFQQLFQVHYPMLITGARLGDSLKTEKTLPQITEIKSFPLTIFIGKDGKVKLFDSGFNGPGTGIHYEEYQQHFKAVVDRLLAE